VIFSNPFKWLKAAFGNPFMTAFAAFKILFNQQELSMKTTPMAYGKMASLVSVFTEVV
jgi:hypothetical protein